ncbi:MAG: glycosyltransferase [Candidatus Bathyarchaeota archaeon]|nr:glycosyltransferase [Candidatus Bathyarchaeota archaeon]
MLGKIDVVMWTKNGAATLPLVLKRLSESIPEESINNRIIVDDHSTDATRDIAESFGWRVIFNEGTGVSDGANTALKNVETDCFMSVEQDLLLTKDWWNKIPALLSDPKTAVASGVRFVAKPIGLRKLELQMAKKCLGEEKFLLSPQSAQQEVFTFGKTLDNTIYKTRVIRAVGGFPRTDSGAGVDTILIYKLQQAGFRWVVNPNVESLHLRGGLREALRHQYWYGTVVREVWGRLRKEFNVPLYSESNLLYRLLISPASGLLAAFKTKEPTVIYIYPLMRFYYIRGLLTTSRRV